MKSTVARFCLLILALFLTLYGCRNVEGSHDEEKINEFKYVKLPIYRTASNIDEDFYEKYLIKHVKYNVEMYYPAEAIIKFYDKEMANISFEPFVEDYYEKRDRSWSTYVDGTKKGEPDVTSCKMSWANQDQTKRATLVLKYYWPNKEKRRVLNTNKKLEVEFRIQPFYLEPRQN